MERNALPPQDRIYELFGFLQTIGVFEKFVELDYEDKVSLLFDTVSDYEDKARQLDKVNSTGNTLALRLGRSAYLKCYMDGQSPAELDEFIEGKGWMVRSSHDRFAIRAIKDVVTVSTKLDESRELLERAELIRSAEPIEGFDLEETFQTLIESNPSNSSYFGNLMLFFELRTAPERFSKQVVDTAKQQATERLRKRLNGTAEKGEFDQRLHAGAYFLRTILADKYGSTQRMSDYANYLVAQSGNQTDYQTMHDTISTHVAYTIKHLYS